MAIKVLHKTIKDHHAETIRQHEPGKPIRKKKRIPSEGQ
jgi:hypothetical protein